MTEETATNPVEGAPAPETGVDTAPVATADNTAETEGLLPEGEQQTIEEEFEEVERAGQKYRVPKALAPELLMHADYTRKTQEVAATRQELEHRQQAFAQQVQSHQALTTELGQYHALSAQIAQYDPQAIAELAREDPGQAMQFQLQRQALLEQQAALGQTITQKQQQQAFEQQRANARQIEEGAAVLQRDIPGWSPDLASKISDFGQKTFGFTAAEIGQVVDPRMVKVLHLALQAHETNQKQAEAQRVSQGQRTAPAPTLRGPSGQFAADPTAMSFEQYKAAREAGKI